MARKVRHVFSGPGRAKYPWDKWTDGDTWEITRGEDYEISTYNMQIALHARANTNGLKVQTQTWRRDDSDSEGLFFQFTDQFVTDGEA